MRENEIGQPIGDAVEWREPKVPSRSVLRGRFVTLEPLDRNAHALPLWEAFSLDVDRANWTYLSHGPYDRYEDFADWVGQSASSDDPLFLAIVNLESRAVGVASYLRITPAAGTIEVGHIHMSPLLQRTPAATEAMYLMMRRAFELGYRRYEWKCDSMNAPSRAAAERLGFTFEGIFRQALVYKGRNRDTAWYSIVDSEWPRVRDGFERWLSPDNFESDGGQRQPLRSLISRNLF